MDPMVHITNLSLYSGMYVVLMYSTSHLTQFNLKWAILKWNPSSQKYTTTLDRAFQNMIYLHIAVIIDFSRCHNLIFIVIFPTKTNCISISLFYFDKLKYLLKSEHELEFQEVWCKMYKLCVKIVCWVQNGIFQFAIAHIKED